MFLFYKRQAGQMRLDVFLLLGSRLFCVFLTTRERERAVWNVSDGQKMCGARVVGVLG